MVLNHSLVTAFTVLLALAVLAVIRVIGNRAFRVVPEPVPDIDGSGKTSLSAAVDALLVDQSDQSTSLYSPLGKASTALLSRFRLANLAEQAIDVQYYLFNDDEAGRALLANLIAAAGRGVKVRLLLDDIDIKGRESVLSRLVSEIDLLQIRIFNPVWLRHARLLDYLARFPRSSRRMHNKSFTVDNIATIVGGRNIGNEYFNVGGDVSFADFDILAAGPVAAEVVNEFECYWYSGIAVDVAQLGRPASDDRYARWKESVVQCQQRIHEEIDTHETLAPEQLLAGSLDACHGRGKVLFDQPEKVLGGLFDTKGSLAPTIIDLLSSATEELLITSPYFIPGDLGMSVIRDLRERGVRISLLTNSFKANDVVVVHAGYIDYRTQLVELGVRMYEFKPDSRTANMSLMGSKRASLHAKTFVIDRRRQFVGSFNLDPRSAIHNTEMGIIFDSTEFAESLYQSQLERLEESAYRLRLNGSNALEWVEKTQSGQTLVHATEPGMTSLQRGFVYLLTWLPVEWLM